SVQPARLVKLSWTSPPTLHASCPSHRCPFSSCRASSCLFSCCPSTCCLWTSNLSTSNRGTSRRLPARTPRRRWPTKRRTVLRLRIFSWDDSVRCVNQNRLAPAFFRSRCRVGSGADDTTASPRRPTRASGASEPVVALVDPIAARIRVGDEHLDDVLGILVTELGRHAQLHREAVFRGQPLAVVREREECLRMQRGRHVDAFVVIVRAFEADVLRAGVRADAPQKITERRAAPAADRAPPFHADVPGDLLGMRQRV